jgi:four helix bundle protein
LIQVSGSVGANYIGANDALGDRDFCPRATISRKEAKESRFGLRLIDVADNQQLEADRQDLVREARELVSILSAILNRHPSRCEADRS